MINLNDSLFIAKGSHRAIYRHPENDEKCLKVVIKGSLEQRRKNNKKWYKRLRKLSTFDETYKDLQAYQKLGADKEKLKHIPRFYGMVETSFGSAMFLDLIINEDGTPARSLASHLESGEDRGKLREALVELGKYLIDHAIAVRDFSIHDVMARESLDGEIKLFIVDGLGGSEFIPLSKIPHFARHKAIRRANRFFGKIMQDYPKLNLPNMDQKS